MSQYRPRVATVDAQKLTAENAADVAAQWEGTVEPDGSGISIPREYGSDILTTVPLGMWIWAQPWGPVTATQEEFDAQYEEVPDGPRLRTVVETLGEQVDQMSQSASDDRGRVIALTADLGTVRTTANEATMAAAAANSALATLTSKLRLLGIRV